MRSPTSPILALLVASVLAAACATSPTYRDEEPVLRARFQVARQTCFRVVGKICPGQRLACVDVYERRCMLELGYAHERGGWRLLEAKRQELEILGVIPREGVR